MDSIDAPQSSADDADIIKMPNVWRGPRGSGPIAQVEAYWHAVKGDRLVPDRSDVDPRGIEGALSHAFVAERISTGHARIRIAGTHISDLMGMEVRGMPLSAMFEPSSRDQLQTALRTVFDDPAVYKFELTAPGRMGKPEMNAKLAIFPLRNDLGDVSRALGCLIADGTIGRAPRRFDIHRATRQRLGKGSDATGKTTGDFSNSPRLQGFAEPVQNFEQTGVPYLRVVSDSSLD